MLAILIILIVLILVSTLCMQNMWNGGGLLDKPLDKPWKIKILSEYLDEDYMEKEFIKLGYEISDQPDILYRDGNKALGRYAWLPKNKIVVINNLKVPNIEEKDKLYDVASAYMPKQYNIPPIKIRTDIFQGAMMIARPVGKGYCSGRGIFLAKDAEEFEERREEGVRYAISEYIVNPMLLEGKKFHIRYYCLLADDGFYVPLPDISHLLLARQNYRHGDWGNPDIHDTHWGDGSMAREMNALGDAHADIERQMSEIIDLCSRRAIPQIYGDSERSYATLGYDFMVDNNGRVLLIEVNDRVGFGDVDIPYFVRKNDEMMQYLLAPSYVDEYKN